MPMPRNTTEDDITAEALQRFAGTQDPRLRQIMLGLIKHLHAFVKDVELTEGEWFQAIEILTEAGRMCSDKRQEFILFSDTSIPARTAIAHNATARGHRLGSNSAKPRSYPSPTSTSPSPSPRSCGQPCAATRQPATAP